MKVGACGAIITNGGAACSSLPRAGRVASYRIIQGNMCIIAVPATERLMLIVVVGMLQCENFRLANLLP